MTNCGLSHPDQNDSDIVKPEAAPGVHAGPDVLMPAQKESPQL